MCGLTGFARHPDAPALPLALEAFTRLLVAMQHRGRHATGLAALLSDTRADTISKWAVDASTATRSEPYAAALAAIAPDTRCVMGHVRYATHANAHEDRAAHPFAVGPVVGAHNGIITNWREVERALVEAKRLPAEHEPWFVDSQAAIGALATHKDAIKALDLLDGYWALTWTKGKRLHLCRTSSAPLACAYVGATRTLFWHSERQILANILTSVGLHDFDLWEAQPNTLYRYDPRKFDETGTHFEKFDAPFRGRRETGGSFNSARPAQPGWDDLAKQRDAVTAKWNTTGINAPRTTTTTTVSKGGKQVSLLDLAATVEGLRATVAAQAKEIEILYRLLNVTDEEVEDEAARMQNEADARRQAKRAARQPQQTLALCTECGRGAEWGTLLPTNEGYVHEGCVLAETRDGARR